MNSMTKCGVPQRGDPRGKSATRPRQPTLDTTEQLHHNALFPFLHMSCRHWWDVRVQVENKEERFSKRPDVGGEVVFE